MSKRAQIIGAGIGGLTAAHALQAKGWEAQIFERAEFFGEVGAGLQLSPNATGILKRIGLLDAVRAHAFEPEAATIRHGLDARILMYAPLKGFCTRVYGAPYLHIYRPALHEVLRQGLDIELAHPATPDPKADMCVAAQGLHSSTTTQLNPEQPLGFTGQVAWRGLIHADAALKKSIPPHATVWAGPGQHLVTYYIAENSLNFVAVTEQDTWQDQGWDCLGEPAELIARFKNWHPKVKDVLAAASQVRRWALFDRAPLDRWVDQNTALLGDAAHPMLPFLAQGAAQAIEDAWALAAYAPDLKAYERIRKKRTARLQTWARSNARIYHQARVLDRFKLLISKAVFRGPQAHMLLWQIFSR